MHYFLIQKKKFLNRKRPAPDKNRTCLMTEHGSDVERRSAVVVDDVGRASIERQKEFDEERTADAGGKVKGCPTSFVSLEQVDKI